jgi:hypothetical protein
LRLGLGHFLKLSSDTHRIVVTEEPAPARKKGSIAAAHHINPRGNLDPTRRASKVVPLDISVLGAPLVRGVLLGKPSGTR